MRCFTLRVKYRIQLVYSLFFLSSEEFTRVCFVIRYNHFARFCRVKRIFSRVGKLKREEIKCVFAFVLSWEWLSRDIIRSFWNKLLHTAPSIWIFSEKYSFKCSSVLLICIFLLKIKVSLVLKFWIILFHSVKVTNNCTLIKLIIKQNINLNTWLQTQKPIR